MSGFFADGDLNILARFKDYSIFNLKWYLIARLVWWWFTKTLCYLKTVHVLFHVTTDSLDTAKRVPLNARKSK